jgi:hypothetical protein
MMDAQYVVNVAENVGIIPNIVIWSGHGFKPQVRVSLTG